MRRPAVPVLLSLALIGAAGLTACSAEGGAGGSQTSGASNVARTTGSADDQKALGAVNVENAANADLAPTINIGGKPVKVTGTTVKVLQEGSGQTAGAKEAVDAKVVLVNGTTGAVLDSTYDSKSKTAHLRLGDKSLLKGLAASLTGTKKGDRLLVAIPPADAFGAAGNPAAKVGAEDVILGVIEVDQVRTIADNITGDMKQAPVNLPQVEFADGSPKVTVPKEAAPGETQVHVLIEGNGPVIEGPASVHVKYAGFLWKDGSFFDGNFTKDPADMVVGLAAIGQQPRVIPAWDSKLVGQKVGSRVLLAIPAKDAYGEKGSLPAVGPNEPLVFVIDILDAVLN